MAFNQVNGKDHLLQFHRYAMLPVHATILKEKENQMSGGNTEERELPQLKENVNSSSVDAMCWCSHAWLNSGAMQIEDLDCLAHDVYENHILDLSTWPKFLFEEEFLAQCRSWGENLIYFTGVDGSTLNAFKLRHNHVLNSSSHDHDAPKARQSPRTIQRISGPIINPFCGKLIN